MNRDRFLAREGTRAHLEPVADRKIDVTLVLAHEPFAPKDASEIIRKILSRDRGLGAPAIR